MNARPCAENRGSCTQKSVPMYRKLVLDRAIYGVQPTESAQPVRKINNQQTNKRKIITSYE